MQWRAAETAVAIPPQARMLPPKAVPRAFVCLRKMVSVICTKLSAGVRPSVRDLSVCCNQSINQSINQSCIHGFIHPFVRSFVHFIRS